MRNTNSFWTLSTAEKINEAISKLPTGSLEPIFNDKGVEIKGFKATKVNGEVIDVPTDKYVLTQHEQAFRPIINGLSVSGVRDFQFALWHTDRRAELGITIAEASDGVRFGFSVRNSFDRSTSIDYGFRADKQEESVQIVQKEKVVVWGWRQVCSNGMKIQVPLKTCKYLDAELVVKIKNLLSHKESIVHRGDKVESNIQDMQFITEAFLLLKKPISAIIEDAKLVYLSRYDARKLVEKYVGVRRKEWILDQFRNEEQSLWGLYNAITFIASHREEMKLGVREGLVDKASNLLEKELIAPVPKTE